MPTAHIPILLNLHAQGYVEIAYVELLKNSWLLNLNNYFKLIFHLWYNFIISVVLIIM